MSELRRLKVGDYVYWIERREVTNVEGALAILNGGEFIVLAEVVAEDQDMLALLYDQGE